MPDKDGILTTEEKAKVISWLEERGYGRAPCPACGKDDWRIADHLLSGITYHGGGLMLGGPSYPQVLVFCTNCYYTRNFLAIPMGLTSRNKKDEEPEPEPEPEPESEQESAERDVGKRRARKD